MTGNASIGFGSIQYIKSVPAKPARTEVQGNVTTTYAAVAGSPQHFEVKFFFTFNEQVADLAVHNSAFWEVIVPDLPPDTPYNEIENAAAKRLLQSLRDAVQTLEGLIDPANGKEELTSKSPD